MKHILMLSILLANNMNAAPGTAKAQQSLQAQISQLAPHNQRRATHLLTKGTPTAKAQLTKLLIQWGIQK